MLKLDINTAHFHYKCLFHYKGFIYLHQYFVVISYFSKHSPVQKGIL